MTSRALALTLLSLTACGDAATEDVPSLELGTGSYRFEPLEDGQPVELVRGAQGGWHIWLSMRLRGVDLARPTIRLTMQPADESPAPQEVEVSLLFDPPDDNGYRELIGYTGIVQDPACLVGELVRVEAALTMDDGEVLRSEREVMVLGGAYPPPACE
jgi:hypothetical protein